MKNNIHLFLFGFILLLGCSNSNAEKKSTVADTKKAATENNNNNSSSLAQQGDGIVGDWKLSLETYDDNNNKTLDEEERKQAFSNKYFYRFAADGKCLINFTTSAQGAFKGHYEIKNVNHRKKISVYLDEGENKGPESEYFIISVNKDELVLLNAHGELTFWIFKRA